MLNFKYICESYGIKRKPTTVKNPQVSAVLERIHQVLAQMLCTAELDMAKSVTPNDVDVFLNNVAWAICSTCHTVLKASPGVAIFGCDTIFDLTGNVDILDVFKRLILKTCLHVVPTCQPKTADMSPTSQLLMVFFSHHMCRVIDC
jgi:hypothetical protein